MYCYQTNMICPKERNTFVGSLKASRRTQKDFIHYTSVWVRITRVEDIRPAKSDRGEDDVAAEEEQVGDAESGKQVVEHVVHLSAVVVVIGN